MARDIPIGTTFSHRVLRERRQDVSLALRDLLDLKFDLIRLGVYWDEAEPEQGRFQFADLHRWLKECELVGQKVLLTIGQKAPRWPEYYRPAWIQETPELEIQPHLFRYLERTVIELQTYSCIHGWQVENEPLDPSGPDNARISFEFLTSEVAFIRNLDKRPIWINLWGNDLGVRGFFAQAESLADVVGLDLYPKQHLVSSPFGSLYRGPLDSDTRLRKIIEGSNKPVWITEVQAEPWEKNEEGYWSDSPKSFTPELLDRNLEWAKSLKPAGLLLWGYEFWWQKLQRGDSRWWEKAQVL